MLNHAASGEAFPGCLRGDVQGGLSPRFAGILGAVVGLALAVPFLTPEFASQDPAPAVASREAIPSPADTSGTPSDPVQATGPDPSPPSVQVAPGDEERARSEDLEQEIPFVEDEVAPPPDNHPRLRVLLPPMQREEVRMLRRTAIRLERKGDLTGAEVQYRRILEVMEKPLGAEHPDLVKPLTDLGLLLMRQGKLSQADGYLTRAGQVVTATLGGEDPLMANVFLAQGQLREKQGNLVGAEALFRQCLVNREKNYGLDHHFLVGPLFALGDLLTATGKLAEARASIERGLLLTGKYGGPSNRFHILSHMHLARLQQVSKQYDAAEHTLVMMMAFFEKRPLVEQKRMLPPILKMLIEVLEAQGKREAATAVRQKMWELQGTSKQTQAL